MKLAVTKKRKIPWTQVSRYHPTHPLKEKPVSHSLDARGSGSSPSSGSDPSKELAVEVKGKTKRYNIIRVKRPKEWLEAMFKLGETQRFCVLVEHSQELAKVIDQYNTHNRKLYNQKVAEIAEAVILDKYILTPDYIAFSWDKLLMNGQHRNAAVLMAEQSIPVTMWFGCEKDEFEVIDKGKRRSPADVLHIKGFTFPSQRAWLARMSLVIETDNPSTSFPDSMVEGEAIAMASANDSIIKEAMDYGRQIERTKPKLDAIGPTSAGFAYYYISINTKFSKEKVKQFFDALKDGTSDHNIHKLRAQLSDMHPWLRSPNLDKNDQPVDRKDTGWTRRDANVLVCAGIIACWNRCTSPSVKDRNRGPSGGFITWNSVSQLPQPN